MTVQPSLTNLSIVANFKSTLFDHNMVNLYKEVEDQIRRAIDSISGEESITSIPLLAEKFDVLYQQLHDHLKEVPSRIGHASPNKKLSDPEEHALCGHLNQLDNLGLPV